MTLLRVVIALPLASVIFAVATAVLVPSAVTDTGARVRLMLVAAPVATVIVPVVSVTVLSSTSVAVTVRAPALRSVT